MSSDNEQDPFEARPQTCGQCTWREHKSGMCVHGAGPRTATLVDYYELTCQYGKSSLVFCQDTEFLDLDDHEREMEHAKSANRLEAMFGKIKDGLMRDFARGEKPKELPPRLRVVREDEEG